MTPRLVAIAGLLVWSQTAMAINLDSLWDFGNPALSESRFVAALDGANPEDAFVLRTQIARTYGIRGDFERQRQVLAELRPKLDASGPEARTRYFLELGRSYASATHKPADQTAEARQLAADAYAEAIATSRSARLDGLLVDALHMMEFVETSLDAKLKWVNEALAIASRSNQSEAKRWEASLRNNAGYALHRMGKFEEALKEFEAALALREAQAQPEGIRIARWMVAWTLRSLGRVSEALAIQLQLERERSEAKRPSAYVFDELAHLYMALGEPDKARHYSEMKQRLDGSK
jgi:tetratricopeptide (TPR) repeat protein